MATTLVSPTTPAPAPQVRALRLPSAVSLAAAFAALAWLLASSPPDAAEPAPLPLPAQAGPAGDTTVPDAATALRGRPAADEDTPPTF
jgi:hypothetical protein